MTPIEVIKKDMFRGTYLRYIYPGANGKWYKRSWEEFKELKNIDLKYYNSDYMI